MGENAWLPPLLGGKKMGLEEDCFPSAVREGGGGGELAKKGGRGNDMYPLRAPRVSCSLLFGWMIARRRFIFFLSKFSFSTRLP